MARTDLSVSELGDKFVDYREQIYGDSFRWMWERRTDEVRYLVIHHSVTSHEASPDEIALIHKNKGWGGIGYHFVVTKDGKVWYVGDVGTARANVANMNEKVIGICLVGDFTKYLPSDEQIVSTHKLCQFFLDQPQWPNLNDWKRDVVGHKDLGATACPGTSWDKSQDGDMWWRVKTGTPYTPPVEGNVTEAGQEGAIQTYKQDFEDINTALKLPVGNKDKAEIIKKIAELMTTAKNHEVLVNDDKTFVRDVARCIGCKEETKTAVLKALRASASLEKEDLRTKLRKLSIWQRLKLCFF
jgi:hypothetical protein